MKCEDCELLLAEGEWDGARDGGVEEHLRECPQCRGLAQELAGNAVALDALRSEEILRIVVKIPGRQWTYAWLAAAAAAAFIAALVLPRTTPVRQPQSPRPPHTIVSQIRPEPPPVRETVTVRPQKFEPLKIKMLTSDPDVVIYWLIDN